ncbi:MAG: hypothetical protein K2Z80_15390 [Xanthobacteraceae bacterium]|nr:hypothetical protein [Xanthobacteraceae bacterium]
MKRRKACQWRFGRPEWRASRPDVIGSRHVEGGFDMAIARNMETSPQRQPRSGSRPLLAGEDAAARDALLGRVSDVVTPADVLEEIWLQDVVDLSWEVARLRRLKADFLNSSAHRGLRKRLDGLLGRKEGRDLTAQWAARNPDAVELVASSLAAAGMTMDTVVAQTLVAAIKDVEQIDRLTAAAELRRNRVLREIADYRSAFAAHLRGATPGIEDAAFKVISSRPGLPAEGSA